jgi:hypothetical protein
MIRKITALIMVLLVISLSLTACDNGVSETVYYIDYENGTIPLGDLPIGARVVDSTWEWEFRTRLNYSSRSGDETKPVTWIVVAKNHYDGLDPHVTLLAEEPIGLHPFDNSTHLFERGYNHWGESGAHSSAESGLRPWLNSTGIHEGEGFYQAFSDNFKSAVLNTTLPNKEWENGSVYSTQDKVFIPSTTELNDEDHSWTYPIGSVYTYFQGAKDAKRVASFGSEDRYYWTRSPGTDRGNHVRNVHVSGVFDGRNARDSGPGVRPALNLKADTMTSEIGD